MATDLTPLPSSFRDPSGFLYFQDGCLYRQVNSGYQEHYDHLMRSGLYQKLVDLGRLVPHEEAGSHYARSAGAYKVLRPEIVPFISYPYEWCFGQLKDAALAILGIQKTALAFGMTLKDSSAYNIQFMRGKPVLIDTLSFEKYCEGQAWIAYRQFCQHFLAPLALMVYTDVRLSQLLRIYMDGIPLDLASSLLPGRTRFRFSLLSHIHLHARSQRHFADKPLNVRAYRISRHALLGLVDNLESTVRKLDYGPENTEWAHYYDDTNYSTEAVEHKKQLVREFLHRVAPKTVWDLGANTGVFSRIAADLGALTISFDMDHAAVEQNYRECRDTGDEKILPLLLDLTNPSPGIGWENAERTSLLERGPADALLALALIHHLAISNNVPFDRIADSLRKMCNALIIEFVPKNDSQVQRLLSSREDVFPDYTQQGFEAEFGRYFTISTAFIIKDTERVLYLMEGRRQ